MNSYIALLMTSGWVLISGCSGPSDGAKQALAQCIASQSQGHAKLVSFTETKVRELRTSGKRERRVRYEAGIEFDHKGVWSRVGRDPSILSFEFDPGQRIEHGSIGEMIEDLQGRRLMHKRDRVRIVGVMIGAQTLEGWRYQLMESQLAEADG